MSACLGRVSDPRFKQLVRGDLDYVRGVVPPRLAGGLDDGLVRLSVGLEDVDDLLEDLMQALDGCDDGL